MDEEKVIEQRTKSLVSFLKNSKIWVTVFLIIALILGIYIRSMPMQDHNPSLPGNQPGLWDITTNTWTLGPDLDPWLFTRQAKIIVTQGSLPKMDFMRYVPQGFDNSKETMLLPYMIDWTYHLINLFGEYSLEFAAVLFPVIMFMLTILSFFLFVREIFVREDKKSKIRANIIALISTFFMIVIPVFLSRTIAGIPEKESAGFFFMFLAFYLFLRAEKSETIKKACLFGVSAGIVTALMGLIWGGILYLYITIAVASLVAFILNKIKRKEFFAYTLWIVMSVLLTVIFSKKTSLIGMMTSLSSGLAILILAILCIHFLIWKTKISHIKILQQSKLPKNILSIIIAFVIIILLAFIFLGPSFVIEKIKVIHQTIFTPIVGRWNITVAENRQPYFSEWASNFGPFIRGVPLMFWMFVVGSVVLFKQMLHKIKNKDAWILTGFYILFFAGLVFSRYAPHPALFDGEGFISKLVYYVTLLLFIGSLVYHYIKYHKTQNDGFEKIDFEYLLLLVFFVFTLFTARGAVRLIMVLGPVASILVAYLIVESIEKFLRMKDETGKIFLGFFVILILIAGIFSFWAFYKIVQVQSYYSVPSHYNQQWQKAMDWTRKETPQNSVFAHWWDYGYWVQSIGERATVLDGGNAVGFWNYYMGRLVLTGDNQKDALDFLYSHNATHLLIDSSDIGKYGAFSSIGSDKNFDRYSWIGTFLLDEKQTQETKNKTIFVYPGGISLDEDLIIEENGKQILLPKQNAGVGAILVPVKKSNDSLKFEQPEVILVYSGKQYRQNLRYLSMNKEFVDFGSGINATMFIFPTIIQNSQGIGQNPLGAGMYLSPLLMRGMLAQKYILDDPFNNFPNFKIAHVQQSMIVEDLNNQGMSLPELVYYQGVEGPIKIWNITYTGQEKIMQKYLDTDPSKYLNWSL